jgi:N-acetylmuramic acid 6-phosphate etherase
LQRTENQTTHWLLAIDGGGSKVAGLLVGANSHSPPYEWPAFRCTRRGSGSASEAAWLIARENIIAVIEQLLKDAAIDSQCISYAVLMLAGAGRPEDVNRVREFLDQHPATQGLQQCTVTSDVGPLLAFARYLSPPLPSIVVIVGTGSFVAALDENNQLVRAGGWGPVLGDEGSGWRIAQQALQYLCRWIDEGSNPTEAHELRQVVTEFLQEQDWIATDRDAAVKENYQELSSALLKLAGDRHLAAQLAPRILHLVRRLPEETATVPQKILHDQVDGLAAQVARVHGRLHLKDAPWRLCVSGGLICHHAEYRQRLIERLKSRGLAPTKVDLLDPLECAIGSIIADVTRGDAPR